MHSFRSYSTIAGALLFLLQSAALAQNSADKSSQLRVYSNSEYGIKVDYRGALVNRTNGGLVINFPAAAGSEEGSSRVHIFVSQRPFVYLPGTYGGRYYFEEGNGGLPSSDRVRGDSVSVNGLKFARDYWAVYAGEGQWETIVNCYALTSERYYIVSLQHDVVTPMPGEILDGSKVTKRQIRAKLIGALRDTTNSYVAGFNEILSSFSITK